MTGSRRPTIAYTERNTTSNVSLIGTEPSVALGLFEKPVQQRIVAVVIHGDIIFSMFSLNMGLITMFQWGLA